MKEKPCGRNVNVERNVFAALLDIAFTFFDERNVWK